MLFFPRQMYNWFLGTGMDRFIFSLFVCIHGIWSTYFSLSSSSICHYSQAKLLNYLKSFQFAQELDFYFIVIVNDLLSFHPLWEWRPLWKTSKLMPNYHQTIQIQVLKSEVDELFRQDTKIENRFFSFVSSKHLA